MELTVNIKDHKNIAAFLNLIKNIDYLEIVDVKEDYEDLPVEHRQLLNDRLQRIETGKTKFRSWDLIKSKYEGKAI